MIFLPYYKYGRKIKITLKHLLRRTYDDRIRFVRFAYQHTGSNSPGKSDFSIIPITLYCSTSGIKSNEPGSEKHFCHAMIIRWSCSCHDYKVFSLLKINCFADVGKEDTETSDTLNADKTEGAVSSENEESSGDQSVDEADSVGQQNSLKTNSGNSGKQSSPEVTLSTFSPEVASKKSLTLQDMVENFRKLPVKDVMFVLQSIPWLLIVEVEHDQVKAVMMSGKPADPFVLAKVLGKSIETELKSSHVTHQNISRDNNNASVSPNDATTSSTDTKISSIR